MKILIGLFVFLMLSACKSPFESEVRECQKKCTVKESGDIKFQFKTESGSSGKNVLCECIVDPPIVKSENVEAVLIDSLKKSEEIIKAKTEEIKAIEKPKKKSSKKKTESQPEPAPVTEKK